MTAPFTKVTHVMQYTEVEYFGPAGELLTRDRQHDDTEYETLGPDPWSSADYDDFALDEMKP